MIDMDVKILFSYCAFKIWKFTFIGDFLLWNTKDLRKKKMPQCFSPPYSYSQLSPMLFGPQHSSKYPLLCFAEERNVRTGLEQHEGE